MAKKKHSKANGPGIKNYEWFIKKADVEQYAGKWIAVENQKIVASNGKISMLLKEISQSWPEAAITKVPKRGQVMVL